MLRKAFHEKVQKVVLPAVNFLNRKGISPNQLTLTGLLLNFVTGLVYAHGYLFLGTLVLVLAGLGDMLDGPLARASGRVSRFGAFLDSTIDRYSDFFVFAGLALYFAKEGQSGWFLVILGIILGSFITSYAKARAENYIESCQVGIFERTERLILVGTGTFIPVLLPFVLWVLLIGTHATALHRIFYTRKLLAEGNSGQSSL